MTTTVILVLALVIMLAWNFIPAFRARMKGWSTIAEAALGAALYYFNQFSEGLQEAQAAGYLPEGVVQYVPMVLLAWIILKRLQTTTPVGAKE